MNTLFGAILLFLSFFQGALPELSPEATVSVITCGPGNEEAFTAYGHTALRIKDPRLGFDRVYNYGTFDFNTPNFYGKFATGRLNYMLSVSSFDRFIAEYLYEERWVKEQVLDLDINKKQAVFAFLEDNYLPENKFYRYDFFYDNCATRVIDALIEIYGEGIAFDSANYEDITFREMIDRYQAPFPWADFGVDLALGSVIDTKMNYMEFRFLPDYVFSMLANGKYNGEPLVLQTKELGYQKEDFHYQAWFSPALMVGLLFAISILFSIRDLRRRKTSKGFDIALFTITGLLGVLVLWLWFGTAHSATAKNYNLLWANPFHLIGAIFLIFSKKLKDWVASYFLGITLLTAMTLTGAIFIPQQFHLLFFPLMAIVMLRSWLIYYLKCKPAKL
jgi:hypothetical protein